MIIWHLTPSQSLITQTNINHLAAADAMLRPAIKKGMTRFDSLESHAISVFVSKWLRIESTASKFRQNYLFLEQVSLFRLFVHSCRIRTQQHFEENVWKENIIEKITGQIVKTRNDVNPTTYCGTLWASVNEIVLKFSERSWHSSLVLHVCVSDWFSLLALLLFSLFSSQINRCVCFRRPSYRYIYSRWFHESQRSH